MKLTRGERPWKLLGRTTTPEGSDLTLVERGRELIILADGKPLMSSRMHGSEEALASDGCARLTSIEAPCVIVGGLGMGYTLRATLDLMPDDATVVVAELIPAVIEWNRGPLGPLANHPLRDPRVVVECGDVGEILASHVGRFDAILLDVDNGPRAFTQIGNDSLYGDRGLAIARAALRPGGTLAVWSAWDDTKFQHRLRHASFAVETTHPRGRLERGGPRHTIFLGHLPR